MTKIHTISPPRKRPNAKRAFRRYQRQARVRGMERARFFDTAARRTPSLPKLKFLELPFDETEERS